METVRDLCCLSRSSRWIPSEMGIHSQTPHPGGSWIPLWPEKQKRLKESCRFLRKLDKNKTSLTQSQPVSLESRNKLCGKKTKTGRSPDQESWQCLGSGEISRNKTRICWVNIKSPAFHNHHRPFRRAVIIFRARSPPTIISQSRLLFLEFLTFSRSGSNLIFFFPSYSSSTFLMFLHRSSPSVFLKLFLSSSHVQLKF